jgi:hypothetical protein
MYMSDADFGSNGLDALVSLLSDARAMGFAEAARVARGIPGLDWPEEKLIETVARAIEARAQEVRR